MLVETLSVLFKENLPKDTARVFDVSTHKVLRCCLMDLLHNSY